MHLITQRTDHLQQAAGLISLRSSTKPVRPGNAVEVAASEEAVHDMTMVDELPTVDVIIKVERRRFCHPCRKR